MSDTRELILSRVLVVLDAVPGFTTRARNRPLLRTEKRPALILLDGDERAKLTRRNEGRAMMLAPSIMTMNPEVYILLEEKTNAEKTSEAGQDLNSRRIAVLKALADDTVLAGLLGSNGGLVYNGCTTDLKSGSPLSGEMKMDFALTYTLKPN